MKKEKLKKRNTKLKKDGVNQTKGNLYKSEKQYRDLLENMLDGLILHKLILDDNGKPVDYVLEKMNAAAEKILSVKRKDIEGKKATEVYNGDTPFIERYAKVAHTGKAEYFIDYYPGFKKWYEIMSFSPERGYFANIFRDITEQKEMEEEQKALFKAEREQRLKAETLAKIQLSLVSKTSLEEILDEILSQMKMFVPSTTANIVILEGSNIRILKWVKKIEPLKIRTTNNVYPANKFKTNIHILKTKKPLIICDTKKSPLWTKTDISKNTRSYLGVPIILKGIVHGLIQFVSTKPRNFSTEDIKKLEPLTNAATIAIEKAILLEEKKTTLASRNTCKNNYCPYF